MRAQSTCFSKFASPVKPFDIRSCELPIQYRAGAWFGMLYRVDLARARFFCEALSVEPSAFLGGALAGVYAWDHHDTSLGAYAEVGIGILTRRRVRHRSLARLQWGERARAERGMLLLSAPATSYAACGAGKELWGYPKYLTCMRTRVEDHVTRVRLGTELELELGRIRGLPRRMPIATFTDLHGQLLRTTAEVRCSPTLGKPSRAGLHLLGGDGLSAEVAQALGLHRLRPVLAFHARDFRATLPAGRVVGCARW